MGTCHLYTKSTYLQNQNQIHLMKKNVIISGGHSGIGLELTKKLLAEGHKIGLIIRNESRRKSLANSFDTSKIEFFYADLSIQSEVIRVAQEIKDSWEKIDRLFNNAGIAIMKGDRRTSEQGNELHFEINTLAPYQLTNELKPLLLKSDNAKVVTTVTQGLNNLKLDTERIFNKDFNSGMKLYSQSKLAVMLLMNDLATKDDWEPVKFLNVHPGNNKTNVTQNKDTMPAFIKLMVRLFFKTPDFGGQRLYNAGFEEKLEGANGVYLFNDKIRDVTYSLTSDDKRKLLSGITL